MGRLNSINTEIIRLTETIKPLVERKHYLEQQRSKIESEDFIRVNKITMDDIELSEVSTDRPYFGHISSFSDWLLKSSDKRFAEWNGKIYFQSDLKLGKMVDTAGRLEDVHT